MKLTGLHLLFSYQCNLECDHCFVWGSPSQTGTMTLRQVRHILREAKGLGSVEWIYFEGGEPFLYYATMVRAVRLAKSKGFQVGIVTNTYWATSLEDAKEWLRPLVGLVDDLSISSDLFHFEEQHSPLTRNASLAAEKLGFPFSTICIAQPEMVNAEKVAGQLPPGESGVMYRGRAAEKLAPRAKKKTWTSFTTCPYEDLREPGRVHVDPLGYLHICQGISIGNLFKDSLKKICEEYEPDAHPIIGALLTEGPVELINRFGLSHQARYADACHLCYEAREALRLRFPKILTPDQMYGVFS